MNRALRRYRAEKIAMKRWWRYHHPREWQHGIFSSIKIPWFFCMPVGWYRKKKGCECRGCSYQLQIEKEAQNEQLRTGFRNHKEDILSDV